MQGRRIPDPGNSWEEGGGPQPGDYWLATDGWHVVTPNELFGWLKNHHVEEHDDGTITVAAGIWGSNSILVGNGTGNKTWHGYIKQGVWQEC